MTGVVHVLGDLRYGGGQRLVADLASRTPGALVAAMEDGPMRRVLERSGVEVTVLPQGRAAAVRALVRLVQSRDAVLHAHSPRDKRLARAAALVARCPLVLHIHAQHSNAGRPRSWRSAARWAADRTQWAVEGRVLRPLVAACSADAAAGHARVMGRARDRLRVVVNGADTAGIAARADATDTAALRRSLGVPGDAPLLAFAGRLVEPKGVALLPEILRVVRERHPSAHLVAAGTGPAGPLLCAGAESAGVSDALVTPGDRDDVPELFAASDVVVLPSRREGFGLVAVEAMASGRPLVASSIRPLDGIVTHDATGLLAAPGDAAAFAAQVVRLLDDPRAASAMGRRARADAARRFDVTVTAEAMLGVYREAVAERAPTALTRARRAWWAASDPTAEPGES